MRFDWPIAFAALALVPLAGVVYVLIERRRARFALRFTNLDVLASIAPEAAPRRRFVPPALFGLALVAALAAVARPEVVRSIPREQATVILVVDTSGSMVANDVQPSRLSAAQEAVRRFMKRLPGRFQVGMVTFSSQPRVAVPITGDHQLVVGSLDRLTPFGGTAIGDAIGRALQLLRAATGKATGPGAATSPSVAGQGVPPSAIVLLSDGSQNRGRLQPLAAALRAKQLKVPVYTVALGTPGGSIHITDGAFSQVIAVPPDPKTLKQIALETGARSYAAASAERLNAVYDNLASRLSSRREYREATSYLLGASAVLLLGAGLASALWLPRLP